MDADRIYARLLDLFAHRENRDSLRIAGKLVLAMASEINNEQIIERIATAAAEPLPPPPNFSAAKHHGYFRSSADYRLRIVLQLKEIVPSRCLVHLRRGEQCSEEYWRVNSARLIPSLQFEDETLVQSLAIIEYINEMSPQPDILPGDARQKARIRAFAQAIACDIHPLCNLRVLNALRDSGADDAAVQQWTQRWMAAGFAHLEERARRWRQNNAYIFCGQPTLAEVCLIPQMYNARRFGLDLTPYPLLLEIDELCRAHRAFKRAAPENQPDYEASK